MRDYLYLGLIATITSLALAVGAVSAAAQSDPPANNAAALPDTPAGRLDRALLEAIDSGDRAAMLRFVTTSTTEEGLLRYPAEDQVTFMTRIYEQSGGLEVMQVLPERMRGELRMNVRSKRGDHWAQLYLRVNAAHPEKLDGFGLLPRRDPEAEKADAWSEGRLSEAGIVREIRKHVEKAVAEDRFSGVALVAKGEKILFNRAYGFQEKGNRIPNRLDTKFNLGSMNKMFTSVAIAQLVQAGKLSYQDTLANVLPEYPNKETAAKITLHHLLTHTAGLGDIFVPEFFQNRERYRKPADYFPLFAHQPLLFAPGTGWSYSNAGFVVLGAVIEKVSGQDYFDYIREHVYTPAGMHDTDSYEMNQVVPNLAVGYMRYDDEDPFGIEPRRSNWMFLPWKGNPAGGGYSTAPDLLKFAQALRGHKLLNAALTETITSGKVDTPFGPDRRYGYGFGESLFNGRSVRGHNGGGPNSGINSDLEMFWDGSYTVIVMGNYDAPAAQDLATKICTFLSRQ
ncbi:MAG TPA: serine hydrolase domain-containing protein [Chthonomonadaceae bacterium]|nr:serine hydrolase domain-containing protein [Chthonomonadaceae bacterium]